MSSTLAARGSSPLTRGKPHLEPAGRDRRGLIPAHAGKTDPWRFVAFSYRAHPRSRGENIALDDLGWLRNGSSPLTRGKRQRDPIYRTHTRLIPAHAGKTSGSGAHHARRRAHPRSRGENQLSETCIIVGMGSSPLTRGKRCEVPPRGFFQRLIPAHAGKTSTYGRRSTSWTAHPRSRGENSTLTVGSVDGGGSSPLTRGKPLP